MSDIVALSSSAFAGLEPRDKVSRFNELTKAVDNVYGEYLEDMFQSRTY